jgi:hypothetical protein
MKTLILFFTVLAFSTSYGIEADLKDNLKTPAEELDELASRMSDLEAKLRGDQIDGSVVVDGKEIESRLDKLIKEVEADSKKFRETKRDKQIGQLAGKGPGKAVPKPGSITRLLPVTPGSADSWTKLPPADRFQIIQSYVADVPLRWRKRLESYYVSIAAEEAAFAEKQKGKIGTDPRKWKTIPKAPELTEEEILLEKQYNVNNREFETTTEP